ncbi:MAG: hypothetical protein ABFS45_03660 [Pseudomonadota bacterium]
MKQNKSSRTSYWDQRRGTIHTRKGGWRIGKGVLSHGYSLLDELVGYASYFQVMMLNVTGKLPQLSLAQWVEAAYICLSWPDPRIWCNQIGSLGGTVRTTPVAAVCAGTLAGDSRMYGQGTVISATKFIAIALEKKRQGHTVEQIIEEQCRGSGNTLQIPGYARPIAKGDERVVAMERVTESLGYSPGPHLQLAYQIQEVLSDRCGESMNLSGYIVSFLTDQGLSPDEIYRVGSLIVSGGVHACYSEAADREPESFLPLRCDDIEYCGVSERAIPVD